MAFLTVRETAERLGIEEARVRNMLFKKRIPYLKQGGRHVRISEDELTKFLELSRTVVPVVDARQAMNNGGLRVETCPLCLHPYQ